MGFLPTQQLKVDNQTLEIASDGSLRVKDLGITRAKLRANGVGFIVSPLPFPTANSGTLDAPMKISYALNNSNFNLAYGKPNLADSSRTQSTDGDLSTAPSSFISLTNTLTTECKIDLGLIKTVDIKAKVGAYITNYNSRITVNLQISNDDINYTTIASDGTNNTSETILNLDGRIQTCRYIRVSAITNSTDIGYIRTYELMAFKVE
jgi:hypothetical protein